MQYKDVKYIYENSLFILLSKQKISIDTIESYLEAYELEELLFDNRAHNDRIYLCNRKD